MYQLPCETKLCVQSRLALDSNLGSAPRIALESEKPFAMFCLCVHIQFQKGFLWLMWDRIRRKFHGRIRRKIKERIRLKVCGRIRLKSPSRICLEFVTDPTSLQTQIEYKLRTSICDGLRWRFCDGFHFDIWDGSVFWNFATDWLRREF